MYIKKSLIFFLLLTTSYSLFTTRAYASEFSVDVFPPIIKIQAIPPVNLQTQITIKNPTGQTESFDISLKPFTQSDSQNGQIRYLKDSELDLKDPLMLQRIKLYDGETEISSIELSPRQQKNLSLHIEVPQDETISDYYFSILFTSTAPQNPDLKNKSDILTAVATNVLLSIGKKEKIQAQITDFSAPFFKEEGPVEFNIKVANQGEHFINTSGYILIKNIFGQTVGKIDLVPVNILAHTSRFVPSDKELSSIIWPEKFILGPYTATLRLQFDQGEPIVIKTTSFIGAPIKMSAIGLIVIGVFLTIRSRVKSKLRK